MSLKGRIVTAGDNQPPVALVVHESLAFPRNTPVELNASESYDPDGDPISFAWQRIAGNPPIILENTDAAAASFITPNAAKVWMFEVTVSDIHGATATTAVTATVTRKLSLVAIGRSTYHFNRYGAK